MSPDPGIASPDPSPGQGLGGTFAALFAVTLLVLISVGATLPVLPQYVKGPIGSTDLAVGVVTGAYAVTGLAFRPIAGNFADVRGRKPVVIAGAIVTVIASLLYFLPLGVAGLIVARLILGAGEGVVYTASSAWVVDITDPGRRGRIIGLYGLAIWGGLSFGPPIGDFLHRAIGFGAVWAFAAAAPLLAALVASRIPAPPRPAAQPEDSGRSRLLAPEALGPGIAMTMATLGYAALAGFIVLHLHDRGIDHGATIFTAFALTVVAARVLFGWLPDRIGGIRCAVGAGLLEAAGLLAIAFAENLAVALAGAMAVGGAFSLMFPSLVLLVMDRVPPQRRGIAMGTFTACFDLGVGVGAPVAGAAAVLGGYGLSFGVAALAAVGASALALLVGRRRGMGAILPVGAALCLATLVLAPGRADAADPDCLQTRVPPLTRPAEPLRFGIAPLAAGSAGSVQDPPVPADRTAAIGRLRELRPPGRELILRLNRMFWSDGAAGIHRYARMVDRYAAAGFDTELQVRYHPPTGKAGDMAAWKRYVRRAVRILGRRPTVTALSITNEANFDVSPNTSDGSYPGVRRAVVRGILAAHHELRAIGRRDIALGFSFAWRWLPASDREFWEELGRRATPRFRRALDYVGLQIYPGLVVPSTIPSGSSPGAETVAALRLMRRCYLPKAGIGRRTDLWVTENGYVTNLGRGEAAQTEALDSTVRAVHRWSGTLGVSDYRWFNLRDNVTGGPGLFDSVGLLRDDYSPKPAFNAYRRAIRAYGTGVRVIESRR